jgi:hypothetical protein
MAGATPRRAASSAGGRAQRLLGQLRQVLGRIVATLNDTRLTIAPIWPI